jgi:polyisoprenoid-binding protein YceI
MEQDRKYLLNLDKQKMNKTIPAYVIAIAALAGCSSGEKGEANAATVAAGNVSSARPAPSAAAAIRYVTAPTGNAARYRVREQLVGVDLPNDAIGETRAVTGTISADAKGNILPGESKFVVDVTNLVSDKQRRDGFIRGRVLETQQYPSVTFVPSSVKGLSAPVPKTGSRTFDITGNLTVRNVTKPTTWRVTAQFAGDHVKGSARTGFTFADFSMEQPRVPVVLSVADSIHLELDFDMIPDATKH